MATKPKSNAESLELDRLYTYAQIGDLAGVNERRVRRWVEEGRLGYVQLPRGRRILGKQYAAFVGGRVVEAV